MKVYISADIEGITGIAHWNETEKTKPDYALFQQQMTREVKAACESAYEAGADDVWVKDAHDTGRNIDPMELPKGVRLIRGWSGHPASMIQELDGTFDALMFIGYHSAAGSGGSPLSHTMNTTLAELCINGKAVAEFHLHAWLAAYYHVPTVFIAGDEGVCSAAQREIPEIRTVATQKGIGNSSISIHPEETIDKIKEQVSDALKNIKGIPVIKLPPEFKVDISYQNHHAAYRKSFYPGANLTAPVTVHFETDDYFEVARMIHFTT